MAAVTALVGSVVLGTLTLPLIVWDDRAQCDHQVGC